MNYQVEKVEGGGRWVEERGAPMNLFLPLNARGYPIIQYDAAPITESKQCYIVRGIVGDGRG